MGRKKLPPKHCKIDGCSTLAVPGRRDMCNAHYLRNYRYGDPHINHRVNYGKAQEFLSTAIAYDGDECLLWPYGKNRGGRGMVGEAGQMQLAHRIVCKRRHGPPPSAYHQAAHSCGNGHLGCVTGAHLRWATPKENAADTVRHERTGRGERAPHSVLTNEDARIIKSLKGKVSGVDLARQFGVDREVIYSIHLGKSWKWLTVESD